MALGTNVIDGKKGPGGKSCVEEASSCDATPQNGLSFGNFAEEQQIAVDSSGGVASGDIYITQGKQAAGNVVDIFSESGEYLGQLGEGGGFKFGSGTFPFSPVGVAISPMGTVFIAGAYDDRIYKYVPTHNPPTVADWVSTSNAVTIPYSLATGAGPSAGSLFVGSNFGKASAVKLDAAGKLEYVVSPTSPNSSAFVAVDPGAGASSGHVYVARQNVPAPVREYEVSGASPVLVSEFANNGYSGIAVDGASGKLYLLTGEIQVYSPFVPLPTPLTLPAVVSGDTEATLRGSVNPEGEPLTGCSFEYGLSSGYGDSAPCAESPETINGNVATPVHLDVSGLAEETTYHYRLVADNANGQEVSEDRTFKTPSKPAIVDQWVGKVGTDTATLVAKINPENAVTSYRFEWGTTQSYGNETVAEVIASGRDAEVHSVSMNITGLDKSTAYHWRVVAENNRGEDASADGRFTTLAEQPASLPDNRVYELVSPQQKNSADLGAAGFASGLSGFSVQPQQASPSGDAVTYHSAIAFGQDPQSAPATSQYLSRRGPSGWTTKNIDPPFEEGYLRDPIVGFNQSLSRATTIVIAPAVEGAAEGYPNIYTRDNENGKLTAITTEKPKVASGASYCLSYGGGSADLSHIFFAAKGALSPGDPIASGFNLYEWSMAEGLKLVSLLPGEVAATPAETTGFGRAGEAFCNMKGQLLHNAISADGSRAFWTYRGNFGTVSNPLFARIDGVETVRLDMPNQGVAGQGGEGKYWDASDDGSEVFFTDVRKLTTDGTSGSSDLYRYDFEAPEGERLTDLSAHAGGSNVTRVVGVAEDGKYVYFTASGALTGEEENANGEKAEPGASNLYSWHEGEGLRFIAVSQVERARVTPDGRHLAFHSSSSLTGYDNTVAGLSGCEEGSDGKPVGSPLCVEVFLYSYADNSLVCTSCNPSGARPLGTSKLADESAPYEHPRSLSNDGRRVFFESLDSLAPADSNAKNDVYEWEEPGSGSCDEGSPQFSNANGGCLYLISSAGSPAPSYFIDASSSGDDVFLSTRERLLFTDQDQRYDVYDVRVGGTSPSEPAPSCEGEGCRQTGTAPSGTAAPGTAGFQGPADPTPKRGCSKGQRRVRVKGKARCTSIRPRKHRKHSHSKTNRNRRSVR